MLSSSRATRSTQRAEDAIDSDDGENSAMISIEDRAPQSRVSLESGHNQTPKTIETLREKHARLSREVADMMMRREINNIDRGEPSTDRMEFRGKKRPGSPLNHQPSTQLRYNTPPRFSGKNLRDLLIFDQAWQVRRDAIGYSEESAVREATAYLHSFALNEWIRYRDDGNPIHTKWEDFIGFLRDIVVHPANRIARSSLRLKEAKQLKGQSVREFARYMAQLRRDIPENQSKRQREAWELLNSLRPKLRWEIIKEHPVIESQEQIIAAAQRQEELLKQERNAAGEAPARLKRSRNHAPKSISKSRRRR